MEHAISGARGGPGHRAGVGFLDDVAPPGGLTEPRRIAALCDTFGVSMAPHNPLGPVATMVGVEINFEVAAKYPSADVRPIQWYHEDGSVADW